MGTGYTDTVVEAYLSVYVSHSILCDLCCCVSLFSVHCMYDFNITIVSFAANYNIMAFPVCVSGIASCTTLEIVGTR